MPAASFVRRSAPALCGLHEPAPERWPSGPFQLFALDAADDQPSTSYGGSASQAQAGLRFRLWQGSSHQRRLLPLAATSTSAFGLQTLHLKHPLGLLTNGSSAAAAPQCHAGDSSSRTPRSSSTPPPLPPPPSSPSSSSSPILRGKPPAVLLLASTSASKAKAQQQQQSQQQKQQAVAAAQPDDMIRSLKMLFSGAMSAVVSRTATAPLERVKMDLLLRAGSSNIVTAVSQVYTAEGLLGFWRGNAINILRTAPFKAVNFFAFDTFHPALVRLAGGRDTNAERFAAGAAAGITATVVCFPLDVLRTRVMARAGRRYGGPIATVRGMLRYEGPAAFYTGCLPAVVAMAPAGAVFYGVFDYLKSSHLQRSSVAGAVTGAAPPALGRPSSQQGGGSGSGSSSQRTAPSSAVAAAESQLSSGSKTAGGGRKVKAKGPDELPPLYTLLYGALAGAAAELIVYPLEVVRRRMQLLSMMNAAGGGARGAAGRAAAASAQQAVAHGAPAAAAGGAAAAAGAGGAAAAVGAAALSHSMLAFRQMFQVCGAIVASDGPGGFYAGLLPNMLQVLPSAAMSFYTYDTMKHVLGVSDG